MLVIDSFGVADDPKMPFLAGAINPIEVQRQFKRLLPNLTNEKSQVHLCIIRVTRYKPGRRCLIEYEIEVERPKAPFESITLLGKARARGLDESSYYLLKSLWDAGFRPDSDDGICVPEPIGFIADFQMWLQRKVPGTIATRLMTEPGARLLASRISGAIHKLHQLDVLSHRRHTIADELRILHERLSIVKNMKPQWANRLERILQISDRLNVGAPVSRLRGIHRDFYPDQIVIDGTRLYMLDFDLYCEGDPALDIGNFLGHLTEQSLRTFGNADALLEVEQAMENRFTELSGEETRWRVQTYKTLTLARHIYISTQFPDRRQFTEKLLDLCEQRLSIVERPYNRKSMRQVSRGKDI